MKKTVAKVTMATFLASGVFFGQIPQTNVANAAGFSDVTPANPYGTYISDLQSKGVVIGFAGNFNPSSTLTRAEFCTMLVKAFNLPLSSSPVKFADSKGHWGAQYIQSAFQVGAVLGTSDSTFEPDAKVRREEAAAMVWRLLAKQEVASTTQNVQASDADYWAVDAVKNVLSYKLYGVEVQNGAYLSQDSMTRQQAAALFDLALKVSPTPAPIVVNPTTNPTNLVDQEDGSKQLGNITLDTNVVKINGLSSTQVQSNLNLMSKVSIQFNGENVTFTVPYSGSEDGIWWEVCDGSNQKEWDGAGAKKITYTNTTRALINLVDHQSGALLGAVAFLYKNGTWSAVYPSIK